jgi:hypothetical protein
MKLFLALLIPALAFPAVWPDTFGAFTRQSAGSVKLSDRDLWDEYGLQDIEQARYASGKNEFTARAYRFQDSTGAMAAYEWQRPADSNPTKLSSLAAESANGVILAHGNYVLAFDGYKPSSEEVGALIPLLPKLEQSPLPTNYLPAKNAVPNSEKYVIGPAGLKRFAPRISAGTAAFSMGAEAQIANFQMPGGEEKLAVFAYPTPQLAQQRESEFRKIPGAIVKRSGPLVAAIVEPANADDAERLMSQVRYNASITWSERVPTRKDNIGDLIVNIFTLIGILLAFSLVAGIAFGGLRSIIRRAPGVDGEPITVLHLSDH